MKRTSEQLLDRKLKARLSKALETYQMIESGEKVLIGLSGGKDSLALTELLGLRSKIFNPRFELMAAHVSMSNIPYQADIDYLRAFAARFDIPFVHRTTSFDPSTDNRKSPCFLCSWSRRKMLFDIAKEHGCTKIALGHHQDDMIHTLLMNITFQGAFASMPPLLKMQKFDMTIIRPLCFMIESDLKAFADERVYHKQVKSCPYEKETYREDMKGVLRKLEQMNPQVRSSLWSSMTNIHHDYLPSIEL